MPEDGMCCPFQEDDSLDGKSTSRCGHVVVGKPTGH